MVRKTKNEANKTADDFQVGKIIRKKVINRRARSESNENRLILTRNKELKYSKIQKINASK